MKEVSGSMSGENYVFDVSRRCDGLNEKSMTCGIGGIYIQYVCKGKG